MASTGSRVAINPVDFVLHGKLAECPQVTAKDAWNILLTSLQEAAGEWFRRIRLADLGAYRHLLAPEGQTVLFPHVSRLDWGTHCLPPILTERILDGMDNPIQVNVSALVVTRNGSVFVWVVPPPSAGQDNPVECAQVLTHDTFVRVFRPHWQWVTLAVLEKVAEVYRGEKGRLEMATDLIDSDLEGLTALLHRLRAISR